MTLWSGNVGFRGNKSTRASLSYWISKWILINEFPFISFQFSCHIWCKQKHVEIYTWKRTSAISWTTKAPKGTICFPEGKLSLFIKGVSLTLSLITFDLNLLQKRYPSICINVNFDDKSAICNFLHDYQLIFNWLIRSGSQKST